MISFGSSAVTLSLRTRSRRACFFAAAALPCAALAAGTLRTALSETLAASGKVEALSRAAQLDPYNPNVQHALGLALFYTPGPAEAPGGLTALQRAARLDPLAAGVWLDLAAACESAGDAACAAHGFEHAVQLEPRTPRVRWLAGNQALRRGDFALALDDFHRLLIMDASYGPNVFHLALGATGDPQAVQTRVVQGTGAAVEVAYVDFLAASHQFEAADRAWNAARSEARQRNRNGGNSPGFSLVEVEPYLDALIAREDSAQALGVWHDLEALRVIPFRPVDPANRVTNSGFDHAPLNAGLDWRLDPRPYVAVSFPPAGTEPETHALRLDFNVARNQVDEPIYQFVPVVPGRPYVLAASVRSQAITSDSGPRLRVVDPACASCLDVSTEGTVGTSDWHAVRIAFTAPPAAHFVRLSAFRPPSRSFPAEITGSFWLSDVSLVTTAISAGGIAPPARTGSRE